MRAVRMYYAKEVLTLDGIVDYNIRNTFCNKVWLEKWIIYQGKLRIAIAVQDLVMSGTIYNKVRVEEK